MAKNLDPTGRKPPAQPKVKSTKGPQPWARTAKIPTTRRSPYGGR
jgi:hypothetical protein